MVVDHFEESVVGAGGHFLFLFQVQRLVAENMDEFEFEGEVLDGEVVDAGEEGVDGVLVLLGEEGAEF